MKRNDYNDMLDLKNISIVAIDDTDAIRNFLQISLEQHGAKFHSAATASGGLMMCESIKPDIIVLDLGLPDKEGFSIIPEIKHVATNGHAPYLIVLTARQERQHRDRAFELGADAYITKPFIMDELLEEIGDKMLSSKTTNAH